MDSRLSKTGLIGCIRYEDSRGCMMSVIPAIIFAALLIYGVMNRDVEYKEPTNNVKQNVSVERYQDYK